VSLARSALPDPKPDRGSAGDSAKVVAWGLVFYGGVQLAGALLATNATAAAAVQAVLAEWGAGRIGIAWSDSRAPSPTGRAIATRAAKGAGLGAAAAASVIVFAILARAARATWSGALIGQIAIGLVVAALVAVRDELLLRGVVLRTVSPLAPSTIALAACGAAAAAARFGTTTGATPIELATAALRGIALAALWRRDRGAWMAVAANAAWTWATGSVARGGLLDMDFAPTLWGGGDARFDGSLAGLVVLTLLAAAAIAWSQKATLRAS
jgi:hypothetical protein